MSIPNSPNSLPPPQFPIPYSPLPPQFPIPYSLLPPIPYSPPPIPNSLFPIPHSPPQFPIPYSLLSPLQHPENRKCAFFRIYANYTAFPYCGAVGAIESANTVGYQTKAVRKNISQQVCTFDAIGGGGLELVKLIPVDGDGDYVGDGDINIQFKTPLGLLDHSYAYYGKDEYDDDYPAGWYNEKTDELITDFVFNPGEGFQVYASSACNFQYSGEVNMAETDIPFGKNISMQGNIRPVSTDIQDIIPVDGEDKYIGDGEINIQFASALGILEVAYAYYGKDEYDDDTPAGWYNEKTDELAEYTFGAGEGFKIYAGKAGYLRFPEL